MHTFLSKPNTPRVIVGLGTGRSGTQSLAAFLAQQANFVVTHEHWWFEVKWEGAAEVVCQRVLQMRDDAGEVGYRCCGDVAFYYLAYVDQILAALPDARFICLKRDRDATVESWLRKIGGRHPWMSTDNGRWELSPWDKCFPKLGIVDRRTAAAAYWEMYYQQAHEFARRYCKQFVVVPTETLNDSAGQTSLLDWLEIDRSEMVLDVGIQIK